MAIWYCQRPAEMADVTEQRVAERFSLLDDSWIIRWGFFYHPHAPEAGDREGDFLILGPDGHILVLEVKGGLNRQWVLQGFWEHRGERDNPRVQLMAEWSWAIKRLKSLAKGEAIPFVGKALCLPHTCLLEADHLATDWPRREICTQTDLVTFEAWWKLHFQNKTARCAKVRGQFVQAFAPGLKPESMQVFLKQSDRLFDQFQATEFEVLDMLQENRQWLVEGGPGTGKTFFALQQGVRLAERRGGSRVLLLCYNLLLAERLRAMVARLVLTAGSITVLAWEELARQILAEAEMPVPVVPSEADRGTYFRETLPRLVGEALAAGKVQPRFDALVVDEAQDHDTTLAGNGSGPNRGWWDWYFAQLQEGDKAEMAVFFDPVQRLKFRDDGRFHSGALRDCLHHPVHVRLRRTLRYTRPVYEYLLSLRSEVTEPWLRDFRSAGHLPEGPKVEVRLAPREDTVKAVESILLGWKRKGLCRPDEVILLGLRREAKNSSLGEQAEIFGLNLADYVEDQRGKIAYSGVHRTKGLDFLAVILIDFPSFASLREKGNEQAQEALFLGASRTRQLLGVVEAQDPDPLRP